VDGTPDTLGQGGAAYLDGGATITLDFARLADNSADDGSAVLANGSASKVIVRDALIAGNRDGQSTFDLLNDAQLQLTGSTFVDDRSSASMVHLSGSTATFDTDIVYDPGASVIGFDGVVVVETHCVLSHEDFNPSNDVRVGDPMFVGAAGGDYRLAAGSPAIDACGDPPFLAGDPDFLKAPRGVDQPDVVDNGGVFDLGAFERQLPDLVFADGFEDGP
jgi:hypothetical protein